MGIETESPPEILLKSNLFELINIELGKQIVGEEMSRKAIFLSLCSIWLKDIVVPLNTIVSSESSSGKSFICGKIIKLFPEKNVVYRSKITPEAFTYWHAEDEDWTWDNKILFLEDIKQDIMDSPTFRVMCSEGSQATVVRNQKAVDIYIEGKPCILITTAETYPKREILTRFQIVQLDESPEQTEEITKRQSNGSKAEEYDEDLVKSLNALKPHRVQIEYGELIHNYITAEYGWDDVRMRRDYSRLLDLIRCSAVLHQFQREIVGGKIVATKQDYEIARELINYIQTNTFKGLIHKIKKAYDICKEKEVFTTKEIHAEYPIVSQQMWYLYLDQLCEKKLLRAELRFIDESKKSVMHFIVNDQNDLVLPEFKELEVKDGRKISNTYGSEEVSHKDSKAISTEHRMQRELD